MVVKWLFAILNKMQNNLKRSEATWNDLQWARNDLKRLTTSKKQIKTTNNEQETTWNDLQQHKTTKNDHETTYNDQQRTDCSFIEPLYLKNNQLHISYHLRISEMMAGRKIKSQLPNRSKSLFSIGNFHVTDKLCFNLIKDLFECHKKH